MARAQTWNKYITSMKNNSCNWVVHAKISKWYIPEEPQTMEKQSLDHPSSPPNKMFDGHIRRPCLACAKAGRRLGPPWVWCGAAYPCCTVATLLPTLAAPCCSPWCAFQAQKAFSTVPKLTFGTFKPL